MPAFINVLVIGLLVWRVGGFLAAYRRSKADAAERQAEREQQQDWARRMQGRSEKGK